MSKIVVFENVTPDAVMQAPGRAEEDNRAIAEPASST